MTANPPPTSRHTWPTCAAHPGQPLRWRSDGWGWRCAACHATDAPTVQPWQPGPRGRGTAPITPKGRRRPDPARS